jgi:hypothetical protein
MVIDGRLVRLWYFNRGRGAEISEIVEIARNNGYFDAGIAYSEMFELTKTALLNSCGNVFGRFSVESFEIKDTKSIGFRLLEVKE